MSPHHSQRKGRRRAGPFPYRILEEVMLTASPHIPLVRISHMATQGVGKKGKLCDQLKIRGPITNRLCHTMSYLSGVIKPLGI